MMFDERFREILRSDLFGKICSIFLELRLEHFVVINRAGDLRYHTLVTMAKGDRPDMLVSSDVSCISISLCTDVNNMKESHFL